LLRESVPPARKRRESQNLPQPYIGLIALRVPRPPHSEFAADEAIMTDRAYANPFSGSLALGDAIGRVRDKEVWSCPAVHWMIKNLSRAMENCPSAPGGIAPSWLAEERADESQALSRQHDLGERLSRIFDR
jgi:hypothetical protein